MPVIVDDQLMDTNELGLTTVGQVLARLHVTDRLVLSLLIDGESADPQTMAATKTMPLANHTLYFETTDMRQTARDALAHADNQLKTADEMRGKAADFFRTGKWNDALRPLSDCMSLWEQTRLAVITVSQLFHFDLELVRIGSRPLSQMLAEFAVQLREVQSALEGADLVRLTDLLTYEVSQSIGWWRSCVQTLSTMTLPPASRSAVQSAA